MISSSDSSRTKTWFLTAGGIGWLLLILTTLYVCYFSHMGAIGFVGPDEPRYAWIAREMAESGDWITPRLYGKPWFEKPVLYYWGAALSFNFFGVNEATARLPSAVSALLATLALAWLAWRLYGPETARWLLVFLPTTVGMIGFSHAASPDMPFAAMLTIAMVAAAVLLRLVPPVGAQLHTESEQRNVATASSDLPAALLFGFFVALAVLAKGPAAIILCGGAAFLWALFTRRWRDSFRLLHPAAILTFCLTALPWYILCAHRNPDFFRVFIVEHNFKRYLTPEFQHIQPFWFYIPVLLMGFLPWTPGFLAWLSKSKERCERAGSHASRGLFLLSFGLFPLLFFSVSQSKLPGYILPSMGPLACLLVIRVTDALGTDRHAKSITPFLFSLTSMGLAIAAERFAAHRALGQDILPAPWTFAVWSPLLVAAVLAAILATRRRYAASILAVQIGTLFAILGLSSGLVWMDPQLSARGVIRIAATRLESNPIKVLYGYDLPRGIHYGLNFYLHREIPQWTPAMDAQGLIFTSLKSSRRLEKEGYSCSQHIIYPAAILCEPGTGGSSGLSAR